MVPKAGSEKHFEIQAKIIVQRPGLGAPGVSNGVFKQRPNDFILNEVVWLAQRGRPGVVFGAFLCILKAFWSFSHVFITIFVQKCVFPHVFMTIEPYVFHKFLRYVFFACFP